MIEHNVREFAKCFGATDQSMHRREEWINFSCPFAPWTHVGHSDMNPSFGVRVNPVGDSVYKCWACGAVGDLSTMVIKLIHLTKKQPRSVFYNFKSALQLIALEEDGSELSVYQPVDYDSLGHVTIDEFIIPAAWLDSFFPAYGHAYLKQRGIPFNIGKMFDFRVDIIDKRICAPLYDFHGRLVGLQGRSFNNSPLRYKMYGYQKKYNTHIWGNEVNVNLDDLVVLTEGFVDAAKVAIVYPNVLFSLTSAVSVKKLDRIRDVTKIVTLYDYGTGGNHARETIDKYFKGSGVYISHEIPDSKVGDAGAMDKADLESHLNQYILNKGL